MNVAACSLIADVLALEATIIGGVLRQVECYLSVVEIARSSTRSFVVHTGDPLVPVPYDVLRGLLCQMERQNSLQLPGEIMTRLMSLITNIICLAEHDKAAITEIQLRLLRYMDSCPKLPTDFTIDLALLHFQSKCSGFSTLGVIAESSFL